MKRFAVYLILTGAIFLTACQKQYVCVCTNSNTGKVSRGDPMKAGPFTKRATQEACEHNDELSAGGLKDCHLE